MVRLLSKIAILCAVGALFYSQSAQAVGSQVAWDFTVFAGTDSTRTITATQISTGGTVISDVNVIGNGLYVGTVTGGTHANKAANGTAVRFYEYADVLLWADPAILSTGIGEPIMGVPSGSCPVTDTAYMVKFVSWDTAEAANHEMTDTNQPTGGLMTWLVSSNTARITTMYNNANYGVPAWFPNPGSIDLDSGACSGGEVTVTGNGDAGGTIFFTATGGFVFKTNGNKVLLGFPVAAIASKGALKGNFTGFLTWANNSQSHGDRIKPLSGTFDVTGSSFIGEMIKAPATNAPDQLAGRLKLSNIAIDTPSNGFFTADLSHESDSGKALCMVHDSEATTVIICSAQRPGTTSQPANLALFEQADSSSVSCDSGTPSTTCTFSSTNHAIATGEVRYFNNLVLDGTSGGGINAAGASVSVEVAGNLTLQNGASMTADTFNSISADTITVCSTCSIAGNILSLKAHDLTVALGGSITAIGSGASGGGASAQGGGTGGGHYGANGGAGGSHGGVGGSGFFDTGSGDGGGQASATVGTVTQPISEGGGGGGGNNTGALGGAGGGTLKFYVDGTMTVNGVLTANGANGAAGSLASGGGGAGGSIWIQTGTLAGNGAIRAQGGDGGSISTRPQDGGGGAGGRISVNVTTNSFGGQYELDGGTGSDRAGDGENGTFYIDNPGLCDTGNLNGTCTVSSAVYLPDEYNITGTGNLVIASGGSIQQSRSDDYIDIQMTSGDVTVQSGGSILTNVNDFDANSFTLSGTWTGDITDADFTYRADIDATLTGNVLAMNAGTIDISSSGSINADGRGELGGRYTEQNGSGSGGGYYGDRTPNRGGGGGSHASSSGAGVATTGSTSGGGGSNSSTYGSIALCNTKGSGGGAGYFADGQDASGGNGGGVVILDATTLINVEGNITARGLAGSNGAASSGGGGAGGSISLSSSGSIAGSATVDASGGVGGGGTVAGGGGSGGYVKAVCTNHVTNTITYTANGALGGGGASTSGGAGTADDSGCQCAGFPAPCGGMKL